MIDDDGTQRSAMTNPSTFDPTIKQIKMIKLLFTPSIKANKKHGVRK
jgi:hypothetical protein